MPSSPAVLRPIFLHIRVCVRPMRHLWRSKSWRLLRRPSPAPFFSTSVSARELCDICGDLNRSSFFAGRPPSHSSPYPLCSRFSLVYLFPIRFLSCPFFWEAVQRPLLLEFSQPRLVKGSVNSVLLSCCFSFSG